MAKDRSKTSPKSQMSQESLELCQLVDQFTDDEHEGREVRQHLLGLVREHASIFNRYGHGLGRFLPDAKVIQIAAYLPRADEDLQ